MTDATSAAPTLGVRQRRGVRLAALGDWMLRHPTAIRTIQWSVVAAYALLIIVPAFLPLPDESAHWYNNLVVLAQWLFWGLWWPFVIL